MLKVIPILIVLIVFLTSCELGICGSDEKLGEIALTNETIQFLPAILVEELIFKDELENTKVLELSENIEEEDWAVSHYTCNGDGGTASSAYYSYLSRRIQYKHEDTELTIELKITNTSFGPVSNVEYPLIDIMQFSGSITDTDIGYMSILTSDRGSNFAENNLEGFQHIQDSTIRGKYYSNLYLSTDRDGKSIIYAHNIGLIALIENQKSWVLEN